MKRSPTPPRRSVVKAEGTFLNVQMPALPNFLQCSADEKHWLTIPVGQIHPKVLRKVGRAWVEMLVAKSKVKP